MSELEQLEVCRKFDAQFMAVHKSSLAGLARNLRSDLMPINGLRHPPSDNASGWYIWADDYSEADDFFEPVHVSHLNEICPQISKFLGLAPGWRFLVAGNHVDVWYDSALLTI